VDASPLFNLRCPFNYQLNQFVINTEVPANQSICKVVLGKSRRHFIYNVFLYMRTPVQEIRHYQQDLRFVRNRLRDAFFDARFIEFQEAMVHFAVMGFCRFNGVFERVVGVSVAATVPNY
jgi:hypothetical protein